VNAVGHMTYSATAMWFPYAAPSYAARIAEMRPAVIVLATAITIGILLRESLLAQLS
jgi:hypothetical protein